MRRPHFIGGDTVNIYTEQGWPDIRAIRSQGCPFIILTGGRGTGKTYSTLQDILQQGEKFIYLRRKQKQIDLCCKDKYNPFRKINHDTGSDVQAKKDGDTVNFLNGEEDIGTAMALSTAGDVRGADAYDVTIMVYDEFIPMPGERKIKGEGSNLLNLYETVNRNRELEGYQPLQLIMLANSNDSANAVFLELGLVQVAERLKKRGKFPAIYKNQDRGILLIDFGPTNEISQKKKNTALYKLTCGSEFEAMALSNEYSYNDKSRQASRSLNEYNPVVFVGEIAIYRHKSKDLYYCTQHRRGGAPTFGGGSVELRRFQNSCAWLWIVYMSNKIEFENYTCEALLTKYFDK